MGLFVNCLVEELKNDHYILLFKYILFCFIDSETKLPYISISEIICLI